MTALNEVVVTTALPASRDERLVPYCLVAVGALGATLLSGRPELAGLAVPFMLALAIGLRVRGPVVVSTRVILDAGQVLEGDLVSGRVEVRWQGTLDVRVILDRPHGILLPAPGGASEWEVPAAAGAVELPFQLRAARWGRQPAGEVWVRLSAPFGLLTWTGRVAIMPALRVLPASERLTRLLNPPEARAVLGEHRSPRHGAGHEFAELRPYAPGDRLRDLNWGATARHGRPFVNRHYREVSGDVVIVVDAFGDGSGGSTEALARAARAAWSLASAHLQANDRVGLAGLGSGTRWLAPGGGRRAKYQLLETLLEIGGTPEDAPLPGVSPLGPAIPSAALLIALTHLHDHRTLRLLQRWRARGRAVVAVSIDTSDLLGGPSSPTEALALRVWGMELEGRRRQLTDLGIPVVELSDGAPIAPVVSALRRTRQAPVRRVGR